MRLCLCLCLSVSVCVHMRICKYTYGNAGDFSAIGNSDIKMYFGVFGATALKLLSTTQVTERLQTFTQRVLSRAYRYEWVLNRPSAHARTHVAECSRGYSLNQVLSQAFCCLCAGRLPHARRRLGAHGGPGRRVRQRPAADRHLVHVRQHPRVLQGTT